MNEIQPQDKTTVQCDLFADLSVDEAATVRGAYFRPAYASRYEAPYFARPIAAYGTPMPQHHYTYYSVANPDYLLA
jgi:hypothetical protein